MTENKSTDIANASQSATLREEFNDKLNLSYMESDGSFLWNWINENFAPREEVKEEKIELLKSIPVGLFDSTPYVETMIKKLNSKEK